MIIHLCILNRQQIPGSLFGRIMDKRLIGFLRLEVDLDLVVDLLLPVALARSPAEATPFKCLLLLLYAQSFGGSGWR